MITLTETRQGKKKKKIWQVALLLLLAAGGGAYYAAEQGYLPQPGAAVDFAILKPAAEQKQPASPAAPEAAKAAAISPDKARQAQVDPFAIPPEMLQVAKELDAAAAAGAATAPLSPAAKTNGNSATDAAKKAPAPNQEMRLTGIVSSGNERRAVIQVGGTAKSYGKNDRIMNYRVAEIGYGQVVLESSGGNRVLSLTPERGKGR